MMLIKLAHFVTYYVLNVLLGSGVYVSSYLKFTSEIADCNLILKCGFVEKHRSLISVQRYQRSRPRRYSSLNCPDRQYLFPHPFLQSYPGFLVQK